MGKRKYNEEFKLKIVGLYRCGHRQSDLMREFGLSKSQIQQWRRDYPAPIELNESGELTKHQKEILVLQTRVSQLEKENEILKSATSWVEKKKRCSST
jgi:transposase-like protein